MFGFNLFVSAKVFPSYYLDLAARLFIISLACLFVFTFEAHKKLYKHKLPPKSEGLSVYKSVDFHSTNELFKSRLYVMLNLNRIWSMGVLFIRRGKGFKLVKINM